MFYKASSEQTGRMWDTWLYQSNEQYYLFYLAQSQPDASWDNISLAISEDGVHWDEHGVILSKKEDAVWMGTGSTWISPDFEKDGKFYINFSEWRGIQQTIFFGESKDLIHWDRLGDEFEFCPDTSWYNSEEEGNSRWDCIFTVPSDDGALWGYWTASPSQHHGVGFGRSSDGITWESLKPPLLDPPLDIACEHGGVARVGDKYYHMLGIGGGMYTYVSDNPMGPLRRSNKNPGILTAGDNNSDGARYTYFARFFPHTEGLLVNHHSIDRNKEVYFGLLKRALFDDDGTFRLGWWEGNDKLKNEREKVTCALGSSSLNVNPINRDFDIGQGFVVEAKITFPDRSGQLCGLYIQTCDEGGTAIIVDHRGVTSFGSINPDGLNFCPNSTVDRECLFGSDALLRLVMKRDLLEFYLDDVLMQCYSLPKMPTGKMGAIGEITDIVGWVLK